MSPLYTCVCYLCHNQLCETLFTVQDPVSSHQDVITCSAPRFFALSHEISVCSTETKTEHLVTVSDTCLLKMPAITKDKLGKSLPKLYTF